MAKKSGLGRGLGALLTDESNDVESLNPLYLSKKFSLELTSQGKISMRTP